MLLLSVVVVTRPSSALATKPRPPQQEKADLDHLVPLLSQMLHLSGSRSCRRLSEDLERTIGEETGARHYWRAASIAEYGCC